MKRVPPKVPPMRQIVGGDELPAIAAAVVIDPVRLGFGPTLGDALRGVLSLSGHVRKVSYKVDAGVRDKSAAHDRLSMTVESDGTITPDQAVDLAARTLQEQLQSAVASDDEAASDSAVLSLATEVIGSRARAVAGYRYAPILAFEGKTARQLVFEGRRSAVILHLETLQDGVYA